MRLLFELGFARALVSELLLVVISVFGIVIMCFRENNYNDNS